MSTPDTTQAGAPPTQAHPKSAMILLAELTKTKAQRDELLSACKLALAGMDTLIRKLIDVTDGDVGEPTTLAPVNAACCAIRAAIARAEAKL